MRTIEGPVQTPAGAPDNISPVGAEPEAIKPTPAPLQLNPPDSADDLKGANYVIEELGLKFPILYDVSTKVVAEYEVFDLLGDGLPTPAVFILDRAGNIRWQYVGKAYTDIPANAAIIEQVQALEND